MNITGGSDIKLFEVDAAVNKIRAEVDPEAELIFGAIKDENMNGKIRVSIVATSLKGSTILNETKPFLNVVNNNVRTNGYSDSLFSRNNVEQNIVNSIDGATALKLDESYEIKNSDEQNSLIDSFENSEESLIAEGSRNQKNPLEEFSSGVSIESASYMEKNQEIEVNDNSSFEISSNQNNPEGEQTPKLFSEEEYFEETSTKSYDEENKSDELFENDNSEEEDFEIPAFLRRQKF